MSLFISQSFDREDCCSSSTYEMPSPSRASPNSRLGFHQHFPSDTGCNSFVESFMNLCSYESVLFSVDSKIVFSVISIFFSVFCAMPNGRKKISLKEVYVYFILCFVLDYCIFYFILEYNYFIYLVLCAREYSF